MPSSTLLVTVAAFDRDAFSPRAKGPRQAHGKDDSSADATVRAHVSLSTGPRRRADRCGQRASSTDDHQSWRQGREDRAHTKRRLAYEVEHHRDGQYGVVEFSLPPTQARELERTIRLTEDILRHLVVRRDE